MRRGVLVILVCLVVGVVVNVLVAWGCTCWRTYTMTWDPSTSYAGGEWLVRVPSSWPDRPTRTAWGHRFGEDQWNLSWGRAEYGVGGTLRGGKVDVTMVGWPWRSLVRAWWEAEVVDPIMHSGHRPSPVTEAWTKSVWHTGLLCVMDYRGIYVRGGRLAVQPVWPGFALNTLVYGALAWGMWFAAGAVRRARRRRKGLCAWCRYDRKGIGVEAACPECGEEP